MIFGRRSYFVCRDQSLKLMRTREEKTDEDRREIVVNYRRLMRIVYTEKGQCSTNGCIMLKMNKLMEEIHSVTYRRIHS